MTYIKITPPKQEETCLFFRHRWNTKTVHILDHETHLNKGLILILHNLFQKMNENGIFILWGQYYASTKTDRVQKCKTVDQCLSRRGKNLQTSISQLNPTMFKKKKNYTGIPQRDCGFGSQSPQENEHHNKASHMDLFSFSGAYKS